MNHYKTLNNLIRANEYTSALEFLLSLSQVNILQLNDKLSIDSLLFNYFTKEKKYSQVLEKELSEKFPESFVRAIRTSQIFIKKERLSYLKEFSLKSDLEVHIEIWINLQEIDEKLWEIIQNNLKDVLELDIKQVLSEVIFWLENERYDSDNQQKQFQLGTIYSFFIKLYLHNTNQVITNNNDEFLKCFLKPFGEKLKNEKSINTSISKLLGSISDWINFNDNLLQAYCFDLGIEPKLENEVIYFNQIPLNYYKWQLDGIRYEKNRIDYQLKAQSIILNTEESLNLNTQRAIRLKKMEIFLKDLNVFDSTFKGEKNGLYKIFSSILTFSFNRFYRYQLTLDELKETSKNWFEAYAKLLIYSVIKKTEIMPYLLMTREEFIERIKNASKDANKKLLSNTLSFVSYSIIKNREFNRFKIDYDVWNNPFIKIGNLFFSPMLFFANNDWFFSAPQLAIKNMHANKNERKRTATAMENYLGEKFKNRGFTVKVIDDREASGIDGDVDIIVKDAETTLFIQLKRTYFRINPKDAYYKSINSDKKASQQLNDVVSYFKKTNYIYNLNKEPIKWIVSTSFEAINKEMNHCNKINYFDLLFALEDKDIQSLNELIDYLEKDKNLTRSYSVKKDDSETIIEYLGIIGLPLELVEPRKYLTPIFANKEYDLGYNDLYDKAVSLYQKNDKKAIKLLEQCLIQFPNDIDVYGALGNCYANIKDLPNLIKSFEAALSIVPNEPYIKRNYALALIENQKYFEGIMMLLELLKDYHLVGDFSLICRSNYIIHKNKLTNEEKEIINNKWGDINK